MQDVMLDLETFGTEPGCVVRSIGAIFFDLQGGTSHEFYRNIQKQSCLDAGLIVDPRTADWWERQSAEAKASLEIDPAVLSAVVTQFAYWFKARGGVRVWCQGATFDAPVWQAACKAIGHGVPWKFWDVRDTRTAYDLYRFDPKSFERAGTYHNALADAKHQVTCLQAAVRNLNLQAVNVFA